MADVQRKQEGKLTVSEEVLEAEETSVDPQAQPLREPHAAADIAGVIGLALVTALFIVLTVVDDSPKHASGDSSSSNLCILIHAS